MALGITFSKNLETYVPTIIGSIPAVAVSLKYPFPSRFVWLYEAKRANEPLMLSEDLEEMVLDELETFDKCPDKNRSDDKFIVRTQKVLSVKYRIFVADDLLGVVLGQAGTILASACYVGVPFNIRYESIEDVARDCENFKLISAGTRRSIASLFRRFIGRRADATTKQSSENNIEWGSELGVRIMDSLVLSNDAKRFIIQRSLQEADAANNLLLDTMSYAAPLTFAGLMNLRLRRFYENRLRGQFRGKPTLWPAYVSTTLAGVVGALWCRRYSRLYLDTKSDELTAQIGETYVKGAVEYYNKMMKRHRCVNELAQKAGLPNVYAKDGDYPARSIFRPTETSLKLRLKLIRKLAKDNSMTTATVSAASPQVSNNLAP